MKGNELINGIAAIQKVVSAYNTLIADVDNTSQFDRAAENVTELIFSENTGIRDTKVIANVEDGKLSDVGVIKMPIHAPQVISRIISKYIPHLYDGKAIVVPVKMDYSKPFSIVIGYSEIDRATSMLAEHFLFSSLKQNNGLSFRCADLAAGGSFYTSALTIVSKFSTRSGGKVFSKREELSDLILELEKAAKKAMAQLGGEYGSVWEYNDKNQNKIQEYINVIRLGTTDYLRDELNRLKILMQNGTRNGMNFVIICDGNFLPEFSDCDSIHFVVQEEKLFVGTTAKLPVEVTTSGQDSSQLEELCTSMQKAEVVDTLYENHPELHDEYFTMNPAAALRIPFAVDKFNRIQYFELGGNAPPHALIAGSTGSGKSSVLHTLIMQTMHHYHPDDVEIWAIDYKAVEFNFYIQNPTPHFRVIAHDTSTEFSLSLIDLLYKEYEDRQQKFLDEEVSGIGAYRRKMGKSSMPYILVIIDEFQMLTQAVMDYNGYKDYRLELENLLRLTRAMGISFVFSSQTIASGLTGLSDAARDQIGCRLCLKHENDNEIRETLNLSGTDANAIVYRAKELRRGQAIYKRARWANEHSPDGKGFEFLRSDILYMNENLRRNMIAEINRAVGCEYTPKETIIVRGEGRFALEEKVRHPIQKFTNMDYVPDENSIEWYPAAPTSLVDFFRVEIDRAAGSNILLIGELDNLRESVALHSICGFLMDSQTKVIANFMDEHNPARKRIIDLLQKVHSSRFIIRVGVENVMDSICDLKKIRPNYNSNTIYLWYGLDKLKNEIFLKSQSDEDEVLPESQRSIDFEIPENIDWDALIDDAYMAIENGNMEFGKPESKHSSVGIDMLTYDQCVAILKTAFDAGPENGLFHFAIFNNLKSMKRSSMIEQGCFENIIAAKISADDSYELFGSGNAVKKADNDTVIYSSGDDKFIPLRPYTIPDDKWLERFNQALHHEKS